MKAPSRSGKCNTNPLWSTRSGGSALFYAVMVQKKFERATMTRIGRYQI
jgi:hypothetical protein